MAKADGTVSRAEVAAFKQVFKIPPDEINQRGAGVRPGQARCCRLRRLCAAIGAYVRGPPSGAGEELIDGLFHIARADGEVHEAEIAFIREVAGIFGFSDADFVRLREVNIGPDLADPYTIAGRRGASRSDDEIRTSWRRLMRENHPDKLMAQGLPAEFVALANEKVATLNAAYDRIAKERGIK